MEALMTFCLQVGQDHWRKIMAANPDLIQRMGDIEALTVGLEDDPNGVNEASSEGEKAILGQREARQYFADQLGAIREGVARLDGQLKEHLGHLERLREMQSEIERSVASSTRRRPARHDPPSPRQSVATGPRRRGLDRAGAVDSHRSYA